MIWLTEVAAGAGREGRGFIGRLQEANEQANPDLPRLALKLATGAGKTTVMAMLIAWQTVNAVRLRPRACAGFTDVYTLQDDFAAAVQARAQTRVGDRVGCDDYYLPARSRTMDRLAHQEADGVKHFSECPMCGGATVEKEVEKLLRGGVNFASVTVNAEVCLHCGERLYSTDTVKHFEQVRAKLSSQEVSEFEPLGQSFQVR